MDFKSFLAGILTAYGIVNLMAVFKVGIYVAMPILVMGFDVGNLVLSILALACAFLLTHS